MKLFVETSDIREAEKLGRLPFIDGMCLNPARLKLYGQDDLVQLKGSNKELLLDLNGEQWEDWFEEGMKLASLFETTEGVTFRVPATSGALQLASEFKVRSQNTCIRFINDIHQGYLSMQSGAQMLSIPLLELGERGINGLHLATELIRLRDRYGYTCRIMLSQVSDGLRLTEALACGVDAVSISASLVYKMQQNLLDNQSASRYVHESKLHIMKVGDVMRTEHVRVGLNHTIIEATAEMTLGGLGAVAVVNDDENCLEFLRMEI